MNLVCKYGTAPLRHNLNLLIGNESLILRHECASQWKKNENILQGGTPKKIVGKKRHIWCILVQIDNYKNDPKRPKNTEIS